MKLGGAVTGTGGAEVSTDLAEGTISFRAAVAKTFLLDYDVAFGDAPLAAGKIRVDVREREKRGPVAMPDTATLYGPASTIVDVLVNDFDPRGGVLMVESARALAADQLDVAVIDGRWVRISSRQGEIRPTSQVVRYVASNGSRSVVGEIQVTQRPVPRDNAPRHGAGPGDRAGRVERGDRRSRQRLQPVGRPAHPGRRPRRRRPGPAGDHRAGRPRRRARRGVRVRPGGALRRSGRRQDGQHLHGHLRRQQHPGGELARPGGGHRPARGQAQPAAPGAHHRGSGGRRRHHHPAAARFGARPRRRQRHRPGPRLGPDARPGRQGRRQLDRVPGLPVQHRHRRVRLPDHRRPRRPGHRHGADGRHQPEPAAAAAGRRRLHHRRARPPGDGLPAGQRLRLRRRQGGDRAGRPARRRAR